MSLANWEDILEVCDHQKRVSMHENKQREDSSLETTKWEKEIGRKKIKLGQRNGTKRITK